MCQVKEEYFLCCRLKLNKMDFGLIISFLLAMNQVVVVRGWSFWLVVKWFEDKQSPLQAFLCRLTFVKSRKNLESVEKMRRCFGDTISAESYLGNWCLGSVAVCCFDSLQIADWVETWNFDSLVSLQRAIMLVGLVVWVAYLKLSLVWSCSFN